MDDNTTEISRRFAKLDERMAQVDAAIARVQALTAAMNARFLEFEEHTAAEVQAAAGSLDELGERVGQLEARAARTAKSVSQLTDLETVAADANGEHPGRVEAAAGALPWVMTGDGSVWLAPLPDGHAASVERLLAGDENGDGAAFLPRAGDAVGPVCSGLLGAMAWVWNFAGAAK
jgi:hypothetical protein